MQTSEERLEALEKRIEDLEREVLTLKQRSTAPESAPLALKKPPQKTAETLPKGSLKNMLEDKPTVKPNKTSEAFLGKYIVGALAALLIFTGTASFIGLIWKFLSPEIKMSLMAFVSVAVSGAGFYFIQKKKTPIAAVTLGIGAGLMYITILSANLAFHMIGSQMTLLLAGLWAVLFIVSSRYTNLFFTLVIAHMGSFITLILGLGYLKNSGDYTLLTLFNIVISLVVLWVAKAKKRHEKNVVLSLTLVNFSVLLIGWFTQVAIDASLLSSAAMPLVINLALLLILNAMYSLSKDVKSGVLTLIPGLFVTALTALNLLCLSEVFFHWDAYVGYSLFFGLMFSQLAFSQWRHQPLESKLTVFHTLVLSVTAILLGYEVYDAPTGLVAIGVLLLALERIFETKHQGVLVGLIVCLDALLLVFSPADNPLFVAIGLVQIGLITYILWYNQQFKTQKTNGFLKFSALMVMLLSSIAISRHTCMLVNPNTEAYVYLDLSFIIMLALTGLLWRLEFFKDPTVVGVAKESKLMAYTLYTLMTGLYFYGLSLLNLSDHLLFKLLMTLSLTALALAQSWLFLKGRERQNAFVGFWLVFKYLLLTWTVILSFAELDAASAIYSVTGLIVAILSISIGFKLSIKSIRLYGLVLTIIMVAKFILVDLSQENSIVRVIALVLGGGLCFLISYIYNRLSEEAKTTE